MTKPAWTPGPWRVEDPLGPDILSIVSNPDGEVYDWGHVAQISVRPEDAADIPATQAKANARLIAAAPDLYEALADLLSHTDVKGISPLMRSNARDALARARGEQP